MKQTVRDEIFFGGVESTPACVLRDVSLSRRFGGTYRADRGASNQWDKSEGQG